MAVFSCKKYNFYNYHHNKPFVSSPHACMIHTLLSSVETPRFLPLVDPETTGATDASGLPSPPFPPSSGSAPVSRSHFIAVEETIQEVLTTYNSPKDFRFFTETFYQHSKMPKNWWLSARTERETEQTFWYLKKDPVLVGNEIIYCQTESSLAILDELKQCGIFPPDDDLSKLTPYAKFQTLRLLWNDSNIFVDVARFGENDYYVLVTSKEPLTGSEKLSSQGNTKIVEYLHTVDPSRIQEGVELQHYTPSPFHFERFPVSLIADEQMKNNLEKYGPVAYEEFLQCRESLEEFFGQDSPFEYVPDDGYGIGTW